MSWHLHQSQETGPGKSWSFTSYGPSNHVLLLQVSCDWASDGGWQKNRQQKLKAQLPFQSCAGLSHTYFFTLGRDLTCYQSTVSASLRNFLKKQILEAREVIQWVKCLLFKPEELSLDPQHPHQSQTPKYEAVNPELGWEKRLRQADPKLVISRFRKKPSQNSTTTTNILLTTIVITWRVT